MALLFQFFGALDVIVARWTIDLAYRVIFQHGCLGLLCARHIIFGMDQTVQQLQRPLIVTVCTRLFDFLLHRSRTAGHPDHADSLVLW